MALPLLLRSSWHPARPPDRPAPGRALGRGPLRSAWDDRHRPIRPRGEARPATRGDRHGEDGLIETEPAGGGFYAGPPAFDVSHGELVSTVDDFHRFTRLLVGGGRGAGTELLSAEHLQQLTSDQVPAANKTPDSFFPGFWNGMGWGFGVGVQLEGPLRGRYGWAG